MSTRNKITTRFSLPIETVNCFEKLAKIENKTKNQLFEDMLELYAEQTVDRIVHEFRAECIAGMHSDGQTEKKIEKMIRKIKDN